MLNLFNFSKKQPEKKKPAPKMRSYRVRRWAGADTGELFSDWTISNLSANKEILSQLRLLQARSRDLFQNNDYAAGYLRRIRTNILNPHALHEGMKLQSKVKNFDGKPDKYANDLLEDGWKKFCKKQNCTVTKQLTMADVLAITMQSAARDGSVLIRKHRFFKNESSFALQPLSIDYLDKDYNVEGSIISGIEYDQWKAPKYYHLYKNNPGDFIQQERVKIPASDIIHFFLPQHPEQLLAVPWLHASMARLRMLSGFEDSNAAGTRAGASKMGFFVPPEGGSYTGEDINEDDTDTDPGYISEAGVLSFEELPAGSQFIPFNTDYPNAAFQEFTNHMLRGTAAGLQSSYINFANDPGAANFASMRQSEVSESDMWTDLQSLLIMHVLTDIYEEWLTIQLTTGAIPLPLSKFDKFNQPTFIGKRWKSYKPVEDAKADILLKDAGVITTGDIIAKNGGDHDDTMDRYAREKEKQAAVGFGVIENSQNGTEAKKQQPVDNKPGNADGSSNGSE